jgi:hypothetical protein
MTLELTEEYLTAELISAVDSVVNVAGWDFGGEPTAFHYLSTDETFLLKKRFRYRWYVRFNTFNCSGGNFIMAIEPGDEIHIDWNEIDTEIATGVQIPTPKSEVFDDSVMSGDFFGIIELLSPTYFEVPVPALGHKITLSEPVVTTVGMDAKIRQAFSFSDLGFFSPFAKVEGVNIPLMIP